MNIAELEAENAKLKAVLTEVNAIIKSPDKWMRWCDIKVLERAEAFERRADEAYERCEKVCESLEVMDKHGYSREGRDAALACAAAIRAFRTEL